MSATTATVTVLYPANKGYTFDMDYYLKTHMPLASKRWGPLGLKQYYVADLRHTEQPYSVQATLVWEHADGALQAFKAAGDAHAAEIMGDVKNFSSEQPILLTGGVVGTLS